MPSLYTCALFVLRLRRRPGRRAIAEKPNGGSPRCISCGLSSFVSLETGLCLRVGRWKFLMLSSASLRVRTDDYMIRIVPRERVAHMDMRLCESSTCSHREQHIRAGAPTGDRTRRPGTIDATPHAREHGADTAPGHLRTGLSRESPSRKNGLCGSLNYLNT